MRGHIAKKGNRYYIVVRVEDELTGKSKPKWMPGSYEKKRDAENALPSILKKLQEGPYIEQRNEPLGDYIGRWLEKKKTSVKPATWSSYAWLVNSHLIPNMGKTTLPKLKREHFHELYHKKLLPILAVASIRKLHVIVVAALDEARYEGQIAINPAEGVELPKGTRPKFDVWTEEQLELFLEEARKDQYAIAFELAAETGMRESEICGLPRDGVHLDQALLSVTQAYTKAEKGYGIDDTKNNSSVRPVPLFKNTVISLREHLEKQKVEREQEGYKDHGLVIQTSVGTPVSPRNLLRNYDRIIRNVMRQQEALKAAGEPYVSFKRIKFHELRHTHATILLKNGVHPKIVQERLGHSSIQVTLNTYSHVIPNLQESILKSIGSSIIGGKGKAARTLNQAPVDPDEGRPIVAVEYEAFKPETYRGIEVLVKGDKVIFNSGDFYRDYGQVVLEYPNAIQLPSVSQYMEDLKRDPQKNIHLRIDFEKDEKEFERVK
ncbi:tyrosine-type recombinase/integrase [Cohnella xylanilytica]|uniref:Tyrosine-type recombinase/integrase n=1 Tax=Cohnella xylanilytica TaxID=557555 RepID=A0A841TNW8_9BACL|nr:site-specific integrase [Cohnella xylanilytica]MBB6689957.1 tyrosine-type recombinase/integrase [Cohnella xylanilytica]